MKKVFSNKKTVSLVNLIIYTVSFSAIFSNFSTYYYDNVSKTSKNIEFQKNQIEYSLYFISTIVENESFLKNVIVAGKFFSFYDFYEIKKNGIIVLSPPEEKTPGTSEFKIGSKHMEVSCGSTKCFGTKKIIGNYEITLGYFLSNREIFTFSAIIQILTQSLFWIIILVLEFIFIVFYDSQE